MEKKIKENNLWNVKTDLLHTNSVNVISFKSSWISEFKQNMDDFYQKKIKETKIEKVTPKKSN